MYVEGELQVNGPAGSFQVTAKGQTLYVEPNGHTRWSQLMRNRLAGDERFGVLLDKAGLTVAFRTPLGIRFFAGRNARRGSLSRLLKSPWALTQN